MQPREDSSPPTPECQARPTFWRRIADEDPPEDEHILFRAPELSDRDAIWYGFVSKNGGDPLDWEWNCLTPDLSIVRLQPESDPLPTHWGRIPEQAKAEIEADYQARRQKDLAEENLLRAAVKASCTCGGRGERDPKACPACKVWHRMSEGEAP